MSTIGVHCAIRYFHTNHYAELSERAYLTGHRAFICSNKTLICPTSISNHGFHIVLMEAAMVFIS